MNFNKKSIITLLVSGFLIATGSMAYAEDADSAKNISDTITHLEKAAIEAGKSDFSTAKLYLKSARLSSAEIKGHDAATKAGLDDINNGIKAVSTGEPEKAVAEINKAIAVYKAL